MTLDLTARINELVRLAHKQGHLTYSDTNETLPNEMVSVHDLDRVYTRLRDLEVDIIDSAPSKST